MYFPDLFADHGIGFAPFYFAALKVGWLDVEHDFQKGEVAEQFLEKLFAFCVTPHLFLCGYHRCNLTSTSTNSCSSRDSGMVTIERGNKQVKVGDSEFFVETDSGLLYHAPTLIYHYVSAHHYLPPQCFIEALLRAEPADFPSLNHPRDRETQDDWERRLRKKAERSIEGIRLAARTV